MMVDDELITIWNPTNSIARSVVQPSHELKNRDWVPLEIELYVKG
jgi:hypothetical protein